MSSSAGSFQVSMRRLSSARSSISMLPLDNVEPNSDTKKVKKPPPTKLIFSSTIRSAITADTSSPAANPAAVTKAPLPKKEDQPKVKADAVTPVLQLSPALKPPSQYRNEPRERDNANIALAWPYIRNSFAANGLDKLSGFSYPDLDEDPSDIHKWIWQPGIYDILATQVLYLDMKKSKSGVSLKALPQLLEVFLNLQAIDLSDHEELSGYLGPLHWHKLLLFLDLTNTKVKKEDLPKAMQLVVQQNEHEEHRRQRLVRVLDHVNTHREQIIENGRKKFIWQERLDNESAIPLLTSTSRRPDRPMRAGDSPADSKKS